MTASWQQLIAALGNDRLRQVYAEKVLGIDGGGSPAELAKLASAGLLEVSDGSYELAPEVFAEVLSSARKPQPAGADRFFTHGRLQGIPRKPEDRDHVLGQLAIRLFGSEEVLVEHDVNRLLATVTEDIPTLRRALVDFGFLQRDADGSQYWRSS
ncbi:DUF2087 domain-containing protein [Paenarthrobacter sp. Z7-10]|uniref:DUF2087 domain-containing protein n=1 Tax=Paenarthrobacter sp. Z7-10 TaxID=2787635 RepID=UPI0022A9897E|nr:DUF2087 domain-containing protein [Paenarthrobacter sp. Z7-10]MCZ2402898.1 DUF2087 domain-containing protein [Paenarthrobacter sp. Z7-10]